MNTGLHHLSLFFVATIPRLHSVFKPRLYRQSFLEMAPSVEINIPTATTSTTSPPYTIYNIRLRLPLRSFTIQKRYSDFVAFHSALVNQVGTAPPVSLPGKSWFSNTVSNVSLRGERQVALETYLRAINETSDARWRGSSAWRAFLNLPSSATRESTTSSTASRLHAALREPGGIAGKGVPITDSVLWLDCHRDMKGHLHDARLHLTKRDQESTPQKQYESSAHAKSSLVRAASLITALEDGLGNITNSELGEGELRRRRDLLANARKEKDGLENLLHAMATKSRLDSTIASAQEKETLFAGGNGNHQRGEKRRSGRPGLVLGRETSRTRELDNQGLVQLQKDTMQSQDQSVEQLTKIIARQRELATTINSELEVQNELLGLADEEVDQYVPFSSLYMTC